MSQKGEDGMAENVDARVGLTTERAAMCRTCTCPPPLCVSNPEFKRISNYSQFKRTSTTRGVAYIRAGRRCGEGKRISSAWSRAVAKWDRAWGGASDESLAASGKSRVRPVSLGAPAALWCPTPARACGEAIFRLPVSRHCYQRRHWKGSHRELTTTKRSFFLWT